MKNPIVILTTASTKIESDQNANQLVQEKLAACVNIIPNIKSIYRWKDKISTDSEFLLIIKTMKSVENKVIQYIKKHHSYDTPEIISFPITGGDKRYLDWMYDSVVQNHH